jgi:predicted Zn-dependent protease
MTFKRTVALALAAATLSLATSAPASAQFGGLGGLVDKAKTVGKAGKALRAIGEEEEIKIGGDLAALLLGAEPLYDDAVQQRYVNRLGRWLALHSERPNLPWKFGIVDTDDFNAFSTPGGYVLISRGLLEQMRTESELAGVLAHEIAHVVQKHHLKALQSDLRTELVTDVGSNYVSSQVGAAGELTRKVIESGRQMFIRGLDKGDEYEADRMAVVIAARSGYSPYGLVGVLQTLSAAPSDSGFSLMFATHPTPASRIERLDKAMGTRLDGLTGLVDDLPSFVQLRSPAPAPAAAVAQSAPAKPKPKRK